MYENLKNWENSKAISEEFWKKMPDKFLRDFP